jgi:hypothetical protein
MNASDIELLTKGTEDRVIQWRKNTGYPKSELTVYEWNGTAVWYQSASQMTLLRQNKPVDLTPDLKKAVKLLVKRIKEVEVKNK